MGWYARVLTRYPWLFILVDILLAAVCGPITVWKYGLPDFGDPTKGFEPRGTEIRKWNQAVRLANDALTNGTFSTRPELSQHHMMARSRRSVPTATEVSCIQDFIVHTSFSETPRLVLQAEDGSNLFEASTLRNICSMMDEIVHSYWPQRGCDAVTLGDVIATMYNTSCDALSEQQVNSTKELLKNCAPFFFSGNLTRDCFSEETCVSDLPQECQIGSAILYTVLQSLTDSDFFKDGDTNQNHLTYSMAYIPYQVHGSYNRLTDWFINKLDGKTITFKGIKVVAMDLTIAFDVFNAYITGDLPYFALALALVLIVLVVYLKSFVLMLAVILNVVFTICISYFLYFFVCRFPFFPFINLMAGLLLIAVGADDVFIIYDIWRQEVQAFPEASLEDIMSKTLRHGAASILVTSLTTSAALMANLVSSITAIRCFGVFSAISILVTFGLMITWIPAIIILIEKASRRCMPKERCATSEKCSACCSKVSSKFWSNFMCPMITKVWPLWVLLYLGLGVGGLYVTFGNPGLSLPSSEDISFVVPSHPFELYTKVYKDKFRFEAKVKNENSVGMAMQALWGVEGSDNGNHFDPDSPVRLVSQPFNLYTPESQQWMLSFCQSLQNQSFTSSYSKDSMCYMDMLKMIVEGSCNIQFSNDSTNDTDVAMYEMYLNPCCEMKFPLNETFAERCMKNVAAISYGDYHSLLEKLTDSKLEIHSIIGLPIFDGKHMTLFSSVFHTNVQWTAVYQVMDELYNQIRAFIKDSMDSAPEGLRNGWFSSPYGQAFDFYDLQSSLASGTVYGIGVSLGVALIVLLITSLNLIITIYAIITITFIIAVTVGLLVLLGWELNLFESITLTLAIGLSVDFTIHYGIAYKLSKASTRKGRVEQALTSVGSAVSMAAVTTFISGAAMMQTRVLSYRQFAMFLMIVMTFSWLFSTFFFMALCSVLGPLGTQGDLACCCRSCSKPSAKKKVHSSEHNPYSVSEHVGWPDENAEAKPASRIHVPGDYNENIHGKSSGFHGNFGDSEKVAQQENGLGFSSHPVTTVHVTGDDADDVVVPAEPSSPETGYQYSTKGQVSSLDENRLDTPGKSQFVTTVEVTAESSDDDKLKSNPTSSGTIACLQNDNSQTEDKFAVNIHIPGDK